MYTCKKGYVAREAPRGGGGGEGTLIFQYIRMLGPFLGVQYFEFEVVVFFCLFFFLLRGGGGSENDKFGGMEILWIFVGGGHHKIGLYLCVISMHFRVFS